MFEILSLLDFPWRKKGPNIQAKSVVPKSNPIVKFIVFKGSLNNGGFWKEGFTCTFDEKPGVLIESPAYVTCRVPTWRVLTQEPEDLYKSPLIPDKAIWKII